MTNMSQAVEQGRVGAVVPEWTLGDRFRKVRRMGGLGQAEFAVELGTNQKTYASWEADKSAPRHAQLIAIAKRIELISGISASWVLGVESPTPPIDDPASDTLWERLGGQPDETATPCADNVVSVLFGTGSGETAVPRRAA